MQNVITIEQLNSEKVEEIKKAISDISNSRGSKKVLPIMLNNTTGDFKLAVDLAKIIHASKVDVKIEANGKLDACGTILATAGMKEGRTASFDTVFTPFEVNEKNVRKERLSPKNQSILATLGYLNANRRRLKTLAPKAESISAFEAKSLNILDTVSSFKSKYPRKTSKKKSK